MRIKFAQTAKDIDKNSINLKSYEKWGKPKTVIQIPGGFLVRFANRITAVYEHDEYADLQMPESWQTCEPNGNIEKMLIGIIATKHTMPLAI